MDNLYKYKGIIEETLETNIEPRETIDIPDDINFGYEIEINKVNFRKEKQVIDFLFDVNCKSDDSIMYTGIEVPTPVMTNNKETIEFLKKLSQYIKKIEAHSFHRCSFQVNFDDNLITEEKKKEFLKVYAYFEPIIARFSRGYDEELRECIKEYANPVFFEFVSAFKDDEEVYHYLNSKFDAISFKIRQPRNLIEFRQPNGCDDYSLWFNYTNTFYNLLRVVENELYDKEKVNNAYHNIDMDRYKLYMSSFRNYPIQEELLNEFVDTVFERHEDKLYFTKQYLGKTLSKTR